MAPTEMFGHWSQIRSGLIATIESFDESELALIPFEGSWSVGQIMLHIADAEDGWLRYAITHELDEWPKMYTLENYPDKASIVQALDEVHTRTIAYLSELSEMDLTEKVKVPWGEEIQIMWIIWHLIEHEVHHRGELSFILGYLGRNGYDV
jgi:uncharacterized damage-inducible protein DinB